MSKETRGGAGYLEGLGAPIRHKRDHEIKWREWGTAAFDEARQQDKVILLDITAVWCHWCHVMDETSYSDPDVIQLLNERYIPVRVDADLRPDVQDRYISGGWPTTAFLTPDGEKIYAATYVQPQALKQLLNEVDRYYREHRQELVDKGASFRKEMAKPTQPAAVGAESKISEGIIQGVASTLKARYDPVHGGFGSAPKFPAPWTNHFAIFQYATTHRGEWKDMAIKTLDQQLGILDPIWGGFYRYATNDEWTIPHYEKMLAGNAGLLENYVEAYQVFGKREYLEVAQKIVHYVRQFLMDPAGGFYGSQDADVGSHDPKAAFVPGEEYFLLSEADRLKHGTPHVDKRVFTNWASQMASAFLKYGVVAGDEKAIEDALACLQRIKKESWSEGEPVAHYRAGDKSVPGILSDQVYFLTALLDAYEHTGNREYLESAEKLAGILMDKFWDGKGAFFYQPHDPKALGYLVSRDKPFEENSVAAIALMDLHYLTDNAKYRVVAKAILLEFADLYAAYGFFAAPYALAADRFLHYPDHFVVVEGDSGRKGEPLAKFLLKTYKPRKLVMILRVPLDREILHRLRLPEDRVPAVYPCNEKGCQAPVQNLEDLRKLFE